MLWIARKQKKDQFIQRIMSLNHQVLILRGARQVGKTSFVLNIFGQLQDHPQVTVNLYYPTTSTVNGLTYYGRDFFGQDPSGHEFIQNLKNQLGSFDHLQKTALIFVDEVDHYPLAMESIQALAEYSPYLKFVFTGSNLENIQIKNAATGRKTYFDLYPITFREFLFSFDESLSQVYEKFSFLNPLSTFYHQKLTEAFEIYLRLGGLPKILATYLDSGEKNQTIPILIKDLAVSIEENIKTILGEKAKLYEYEDVLRKLVYLSMDTFKYTHLQVQHAGRSEAKRLVSKTVGARVIHKIRLFESQSDLSKFILFDCGLANYLLNGSDLLKNRISPKNRAILLETFVGQELISTLISREDLFYWKSPNKAEIEFLLRSPFLVGIDVKTNKGHNKSLHSFAIYEEGAQILVKIAQETPNYLPQYTSSLPTESKTKKIPLMILPHYLVSRLNELLETALPHL